MVVSMLPFSVNSDVTSGKEMSDGNEGTHRARSDSRARKHHRKSSHTRSRQDKVNRPKLTMIKVSLEIYRTLKIASWKTKNALNVEFEITFLVGFIVQ